MQSTRTRIGFQGSFEQLCAIKSGKQVPIDVWNKRQARQNKLTEQSHDVAQKLEVEGFGAYVESDLTLVGLHSGLSKPVESFRNITFIPAVAKMRRAPEVKFVQYSLQKYPKARAWTITSGKRVIIPKRKIAHMGPISDMAAEIYDADHNAGIARARDTFKRMARKISRLNSEDFMKECGAVFSYRASEMGEVVETEQGLSIHPHIHAVLVLENGPIQKHRWSKLLQRIQAYLGAYSKDCGLIKNPREFVKYCVKPDDLTELSSASIADLYQVTRNLRMHQPLGPFRKIKRELKEDDLVLTHLNGKVITMARPTKRLAEKEKPWQPPCAFRGDADPQVVARIEPAPVFSPITEPLLLVHGLDGRDPLDWVINTEPVQQMIESINVHTKSLIVRKNDQNEKEKEWIRTKSKPKLYHEDPVAN
jgi:hypothetical protein